MDEQAYQEDARILDASSPDDAPAQVAPAPHLSSEEQNTTGFEKFKTAILDYNSQAFFDLIKSGKFTITAEQCSQLWDAVESSHKHLFESDATHAIEDQAKGASAQSEMLQLTPEKQVALQDELFGAINLLRTSKLTEEQVIEKIEFLRAQGVNINARDQKCPFKCTPLLKFVVPTGRFAPSVMKYLIKSGADCSALDSYGYTALQRLQRQHNNNHAELILLLTKIEALNTIAKYYVQLGSRYCIKNMLTTITPLPDALIKIVSDYDGSMYFQEP